MDTGRLCVRHLIKENDGFVLIDALIGVVIIGLMLTMCLETLNLTRRLRQKAKDETEGVLALQSAIESTPRKSGDYEGQLGAALYQVQVREEVIKDYHLCRFDAKVTLDRHIYSLETMRWCDPKVLS